jgi:WD40 repeat protein
VSNRIRLFDLVANQPIRSLDDSSDNFVLTAVSPDAARLALIGKDGTIHIRDRITGNALRHWTGQAVATAFVLFSPDGRSLVTGGADAAQLWDVSTGNGLRDFQAPSREQVTCAAFSPDGKTLAVGYRSKRIRLWQSATGAMMLLLEGSRQRIASLAFAPDGKVLASAGHDDTIRLWDPATGKELRHWGNVHSPAAIVFAPSGKLLASGNTDGLISIWDVALGQEVRQFQGHADFVHALAFSSDGRLLISGGQDKTVRLWEVISSQEIFSFPGHGGLVSAVALSPDASVAISGSSDGTVLIWDVAARVQDGMVSAETVSLWKVLAGEEACLAYRAMSALTAKPGQTMPFLQEHMKPYVGVDAHRIARLIAELDDDKFAVRERATDDLGKLGQLAGPALRKALAGTPTPEARGRIDRILKKQNGLDTWGQERLRLLRVIALLERIGTPEARQLLSGLAKGSPEVELMDEARFSLVRLSAK